MLELPNQISDWLFELVRSKLEELGLSVVVGGARRTMPPTIEGHRRSLPLEATLILTAWAASAELELDLMGWAMLVLEENAVLGSARLNAAVPGVYQPAEIVELGHDEAIVRRVTRLVDINEYKRRQCPPGVRVSVKAFGKDRRLPITNGYRG